MLFNPVRLLIVDDAPADVEFFIHLFQTQDLYAYETWTASTGADGVAVFRTMRPDCVLLDYNLPDMNGLEFIEAVSELETNHPVALVVVTGQGNEEIAVESLKRGALDYVAKDQMTAKQLCRVVDKAISKASVQKMLAEGESRFDIVREQVEDKLLPHLKKIEDFTDHLQQSATIQTDPHALAQTQSIAASISALLQTAERIHSAVGVAAAPVTPEQVDLQELWDNLLEIMEVDIRRTGLQVFAHGILPKVNGNAVVIRQVLRQLLLYVMGNVSIKADVLSICSGILESQWFIRIWTQTSTGQVFTGADSPAGSSDLLPCREIIQQHHGKLWIETDETYGTSICFYLEPVYDARTSQALN